MQMQAVSECECDVTEPRNVCMSSAVGGVSMVLSTPDGSRCSAIEVRHNEVTQVEQAGEFCTISTINRNRNF